MRRGDGALFVAAKAKAKAKTASDADPEVLGAEDSGDDAPEEPVPEFTAAGEVVTLRNTTHHSFRGSFSAVSTPIFASK